MNEQRDLNIRSAIERERVNRRASGVSKGEVEFIARMIQEYKADLVSYVERCQIYAEESKGETNEHYWRAELIEATRRLELSDAELMKFISPAAPGRIAPINIVDRM